MFGAWWGGLGVFHEGGVISDIKPDNKKQNNIVKKFALLQNYPNPFNPTTSIQYQIPANIFVTLKVFDILGKEVASLINEEKTSGVYTISFDGSSLSSGVYFYQINAGNFHQTKKFILLR